VELSSFLSSLDFTVKAASVGIAVIAAGAWFTWTVGADPNLSHRAD
jgi:hypothetical protein